MRPISLAVAITFLGLPAAAGPGPLTIDLKGPGGEKLGVATLSEGPRGVVVRLDLEGLTPGWHGLHFHEKGDCSSADFKSAGPHMHDQPTAVHGLLNAAGNEAGDLPNLWASATGAAHAEVYSPWVSLVGAAGRLGLLDADGSALVVHAAPDDHAAQPIGGAGARVACGVVAGG